ncbi:COG1470 family protein [Thermus filiformis]|uniref:Lipoprotein n=1 Tax=Thermus filiformis TaxID=276 RepID=A0A0D6XCY9_THEFI|nr:choice-of-anchor U domain-containing protein [Thermus filiformis]KIX84753.1 hypothetical protein THFILI_02165 [Thermus filiformis]
MRKTRLLWLTGLALLLAACGGQGTGGGGGNTGGSVNTGNGTVQVGLQGGTFTQAPQAASVNAPGYQTPYGGIAFTAQVPQGGTLTVTLTFPNPIPQGAVLLKCKGNPQSCNPIQGAQLSGNQATFQVQDGGPLDADGQANGQIVDPVALGVGYALSLPGSSFQVDQNGELLVRVSLARNGYTGPVTLSLEGSDRLAQSPAPDKIAWSFDPNPATGGESYVLLQVGGQVPTGTYALTIRGRAEGLPDQTASFSVQVQAGSGGGGGGGGGGMDGIDFDLSPKAIEVPQGGTASLTLRLKPGGLLSGRVILTLQDPQDHYDLPLGFSLYPASFLLGETPLERTVTLSVGKDAAPGTYRFWAVAKSGSTGRGVELTITVTPASVPTPSLVPEYTVSLFGPASSHSAMALSPLFLVANGNLYALDKENSRARLIAPLPPNLKYATLSPEEGFLLLGGAGGEWEVYRLDLQNPPQLIGRITSCIRIVAWAEAPDRSQAAVACQTGVYWEGLDGSRPLRPWPKVQIYHLTPSGVSAKDTLEPRIGDREGVAFYIDNRNDFIDLSGRDYGYAYGPVLLRGRGIINSYVGEDGQTYYLEYTYLDLLQLRPDGSYGSRLVYAHASNSSPFPPSSIPFPAGGVRNYRSFALIYSGSSDCIRYDTQTGQTSGCSPELLSGDSTYVSFQQNGRELLHGNPVFDEAEGTLLLQVTDAQSGAQETWRLTDLHGGALRDPFPGWNPSWNPSDGNDQVLSAKDGFGLYFHVYNKILVGSSSQIRFGVPRVLGSTITPSSQGLVVTSEGASVLFKPESGSTVLRYLGLARSHALDEGGRVWFMALDNQGKNRLGLYDPATGTLGLSQAAGEMGEVWSMDVRGGRVAALGGRPGRVAGVPTFFALPIEVWDTATRTRVAAVPLPGLEGWDLSWRVKGLRVMGNERVAFAVACTVSGWDTCPPPAPNPNTDDILYVLRVPTGEVEALVARPSGNHGAWSFDVTPDGERVVLLEWDSGRNPPLRPLVLVLKLDGSPERLEFIGSRALYLKGMSPEKIIPLPMGNHPNYPGGREVLSVTWDGRFALTGGVSDVVFERPTRVVDLERAQPVLEGPVLPTSPPGSEYLPRLLPSREGRLALVRKVGDGLEAEVLRLEAP